MLEQLQLLLTLYRRPVHAAGRIIDEGRLWFAFLVALIALGGLPFGVLPPAVRVLIGPFAGLKLIGLIAMGFVPAAILLMTWQKSHESFPVMLRKDYLPLLNCTLLALAAAVLPLAVFGVLWLFATGNGWFVGALAVAAFFYFLFLSACAVRTLWGTSYIAASGATALGLVGLALFTLGLGIGGGVIRYLASPFLLYYAWIFFGSDVRSLGDGFRSRQHLRNQLDIATNNPRDADAHYQLGLIYQQRRQFDEAQKRFQRAIAIDPREADPAFQLGRIALEQDRLEEAIDWLRKAAALDDKCGSHEVWRDLGVAHYKAGHFDEARAALDKYVARRAYDPVGLYWQGKALAALDRQAEAQEAFDTCVEAVNTMPSHRRRQLGRWKGLAANELRTLRKP